MTVSTDDFGTDPSGRWTVELSSFSWDNTDFEYDALCNVPNLLARYSSAAPGNIEHEAQVTCKSFSAQTIFGPAVRVDGAANDWYGVEFVSNSDIVFSRFNGATTTAGRTPLDGAASGVTFTDDHWYTIRLAAEGANGADVVLSCWIVDHGTSKPSDPGWIGVDGSPHRTYTDTDAGRLDDSSLHLYAGIGGQSDESDYDTRFDFFKQRTIADRSGGGAALTFNVYHQSRKILRL